MNSSLICKTGLILLVWLLSACTNQYSVSTNLDKDNFKHYFSPSEVVIYQDESNIIGKYRYLSSVEGEDCQKESHLQAPDEIVARTNARRKAYQVGANAIVFTGCVLIEKDINDKQCLSTKVCYGKAFQVESQINE
jgi:RcsF protein